MKNTKKRIILYLLIGISVLFVYLATSNQVKLYSDTSVEFLDTVCEISVYSKSQAPLDKCFEYISQKNKEFSATDPSSALYKLNQGETTISEDLQSLIDFGKDFGNKHPEFFSIYLNPLVNAWDIKNNTGNIPDIADAMTEVKLKKSINLGAAAKGYIADNLVNILSANGVSSAMINLGGNAYAMGKKPTGENWKIGIQSPADENKLVGIITAENLAVITSGDYQRYFEKDGIRYHHIFDPKTGYPANSGLRAVTVICENALLADALSTAAFVAGLEDGIELLKEYNAQGIFITDDTVYFSKSLENIFKQTDFSYKYKFIY